MTKYKYYFKKPRSEITKDILGTLLISGIFVVAAQSPYFIQNLIKAYGRFRRYQKHKVSNSFNRLRKCGFINFEYKGEQLYISLTDKGKKTAGWMQIDELKIKKSQEWDRKWRIIMFDIAQLKKFYREALRGKLKELGFCKFQKSVWLIPYECSDELNLLRDFFGLSEKELRLVTAENIGNDREFRKIFDL